MFRAASGVATERVSPGWAERRCAASATGSGTAVDMQFARVPPSRDEDHCRPVQATLARHPREMQMKVHILDDWFDTLRRLPSFERLSGHEVTVWNDHEPDPVQLAGRLLDAQVLVLFRERTFVGADLLDRLPNLRLISQRSVYPHIDVESCTRNGVLLCSNLHAGSPSFATAELTFALILASLRQIPQQVRSVRSGNWQMGVGPSLRGRRLALYGYGRIAKAVAGYAEAFGMQVTWWGSKEGRARHDPTAPLSRQAGRISFRQPTSSACLCGSSREQGGSSPSGTLRQCNRDPFWSTPPAQGSSRTGALEEEVTRGRISRGGRCVRRRTDAGHWPNSSAQPECPSHSSYWFRDRG